MTGAANYPNCLDLYLTAEDQTVYMSVTAVKVVRTLQNTSSLSSPL